MTKFVDQQRFLLIIYCFTNKRQTVYLFIENGSVFFSFPPPPPFFSCRMLVTFLVFASVALLGLLLLMLYFAPPTGGNRSAEISTVPAMEPSDEKWVRGRRGETICKFHFGVKKKKKRCRVVVSQAGHLDPFKHEKYMCRITSKVTYSSSSKSDSCPAIIHFILFLRRLGNLPDLESAGSLHQFLTDLHGRLGEVAGFWFGQKFCVSVCGARTFKEVQGLFDRPGEGGGGGSNKSCYTEKNPCFDPSQCFSSSMCAFFLFPPRQRSCSILSVR